MSMFTNIRDKATHLLAVLFGVIEPVGEHVFVKTSQDIAAAAIAGTIHGSDDMVKVATDSVKAQLPSIRNEAAVALGALMTHDAANEAAQPKAEGDK